MPSDDWTCGKLGVDLGGLSSCSAAPANRPRWACMTPRLRYVRASAAFTRRSSSRRSDAGSAARGEASIIGRPGAAPASGSGVPAICRASFSREVSDPWADRRSASAKCVAASSPSPDLAERLAQLVVDHAELLRGGPFPLHQRQRPLQRGRGLGRPVRRPAARGPGSRGCAPGGGSERAAISRAGRASSGRCVSTSAIPSSRFASGSWGASFSSAWNSGIASSSPALPFSATDHVAEVVVGAAHARVLLAAPSAARPARARTRRSPGRCGQ